MNDMIKFLQDKLDEAISTKAKYMALAQPEYWEEVIMDNATKEIEHYMHVVSIIKTYRNYIKADTPLKKVAQ